MAAIILMKTRMLKPVVAVLFAAFAATQSSAQVIYGDFTNSVVSFLNVTESGPNVPPTLFVPPSPTITADPFVQLAFAPNSSIQTEQSLPFDLKTKTGQLQMDIQAAPGLWFGLHDSLLELYTAGSYSLSAPFGPVPQSQAFASFTASYTLAVNEVDNMPFSSGAPFAASLTLIPSGVSIVGPGGSANGTWNGSVQLDLNSIKAHFGLGPSNNITGMLLQYTANLSAAAIYGQATASMLNLNVLPSIVPEPSTYAMLVMSAAGALWWARRRR
jgi:hypothetical protein